MKRLFLALCFSIFMQSAVYATDLSDWALSDYETASRAGIISSGVVRNNLKENITREEFCELIINLYSNISDKSVYTPENIPFEDTDNVKVAQCHALGIVSGRDEKSFDHDGDVTRQEMAKIIVNTLKASDINTIIMRSEAEEIFSKFDDSESVAEWAYPELAITLKYSIISGMSECEIAPLAGATREQAIAIVNRVYEQFAMEKAAFAYPEIKSVSQSNDGEILLEMTQIDDIESYIFVVKDSSAKLIAFVEQKAPIIALEKLCFEEGESHTIIAGVKFLSGIEVFSNPTDTVFDKTTNTIKQATTEKEKRIFPGGYYFATEEEAEANMVDVVVDVWNVNENGEKVAVKKTIKVNQFLAEDVQNIFKEIFQSPEQFPIKSVGGYCWRNSAMGKISEHSYGTCIDINPEENYYCYTEDNSPITGTHWLPYEDIYSITPDGAVVEAFLKYGWIWGGTWDGSVRDYMHFSYLGR